MYPSHSVHQLKGIWNGCISYLLWKEEQQIRRSKYLCGLCAVFSDTVFGLRPIHGVRDRVFLCSFISVLQSLEFSRFLT